MNNPFEGITELQKSRILKMLGVHKYNYSKNQEVLPTIKNENILSIITSRCSKNNTN